MFDVEPIMSKQASDCGSVCLSMLLTYYNIEINPDIVYKQCNVSAANGCTAKDILKCGRDYGLDMKAFKMDAEDVIIQDRPSIVWCDNDHMCICGGVDPSGRVVVCDPTYGRHLVKKQTFKNHYSGVALFNGEPADLEV